MIGSLPDFTLTRQENQNVARCVTRPELIHRFSNRIVEVMLARFFKGSPAHFDRKRSARHHDDGRRSLAGSKMVGKSIGINGGGCDHHFQIRPPWQNLTQVAQQKINVEASFVGFVNDQCVISLKQRVILGFSQQNAIGHEFHRGILRQTVLKTHLVPHHIAQGRVQFIGNALGHAAGRNAPGLGMTNPFGTLTWLCVQFAPTQCQSNFGKLGGFTRTGLTANDDDLVFCHSPSDFVALCRHRQGLWELDFQGGG